MAVYLPIFLTKIFKLTPGDAGFRTAGLFFLATSMRPVGGLLADRIGGRKIPDLGFPGNGSDGAFSGCPSPRWLPLQLER